jgi:hypothetical protein
MGDTLFDTEPEMKRGAKISGCGTYRYALLRRWGDGLAATFVMLNPSTADADIDDPTIRRCIGFSRAWGYAALRVVNLYALRSTDPRGLWTATDPVGPENDQWLTKYAMAASTQGTPLIAAWGANARPDRVQHVLALPGFHRLTALGTTKAGQPRHPLYLRNAAVPEPWPEARAVA